MIGFLAFIVWANWRSDTAPTHHGMTPSSAMAQRPVAPVAGPPESQIGDIVVALDRCVLQDGPRTVAELAKGAQLRVVRLNGDWVGCSVVVNGKEEGGWINKGLVFKETQAVRTKDNLPLVNPADASKASPQVAQSPAAGKPTSPEEPEVTPSEFNIVCTASFNHFAVGADGNVMAALGVVRYLSILGRPVELANDTLACYAGTAYVVSKQYGELKLTFDSNRNATLWLTPSQRKAIKLSAANPLSISPAYSDRWTAESKKKGLIGFQRSENSNTDIYVMYSDGSGLRRLTDGRGVQRSYMRAGRQMALASLSGHPRTLELNIGHRG